MNWLNTIRWKNLIIIWISILVVILPNFYFIINYDLISEFVFWGVICSSIAAIGNITNDWMDLKQDKENKKKNIFSDPNKKKSAVVLIISLLVTTGLSIVVSNNHSTFFIMASTALTLLILYNAFLKKIALVGNIVIALLTLMIFAGLDIIVLSRIIYFEAGIDNKQIELLGLFAFLTTLIREILKDAEDRKGDLFAGFNTVAKFLKDKWIALVIVVINLLGCWGIYFFMKWRQDNFMNAFLFYSLWSLAISISAAILMLIPHPSKYVRSTRIVKAGMLGCLIIYLILSF